MWTKVKHIAYLLILDGEHQRGRRLLEQVIADLEAQDTGEDAKELMFYCYRYLAISFHRDEISGNVQEAAKQLERAAEIVESLSSETRKRRELEARLLTNRGNLALERAQWPVALEYYQGSLEMFTDLEDEEHRGITNLKIAQAAIAAESDEVEAASHLETAQSIFIHIGWVEGHARVLEQYAKLYGQRAMKATSTEEKYGYVRSAIAAAKNALALFLRIRHREGQGRIEALIEQLKKLTTDARSANIELKEMDAVSGSAKQGG